MISRKLVILIASTALVVPGLARADGLEIAPMLGYRFGGWLDDNVAGLNTRVASDLSYGLAFDIPVDEVTQVEILFGRQSTTLESTGFGSPDLFDVDVTHYQVGGLRYLGDDEVQPFYSGTVGVTEIDPGEAGLKTETKPSFSLGGGVRTYFSEAVGLRAEGRVYGTYFGGDGGVFCADTGPCVAKVSGSFFWQVEANVGLTFRF